MHEISFSERTASKALGAESTGQEDLRVPRCGCSLVWDSAGARRQDYTLDLEQGRGPSGNHSPASSLFKKGVEIQSSEGTCLMAHSS